MQKLFFRLPKCFSTPAPFLSTPQTPVEWAKVCLVQNNIYGFQGQWWQKYEFCNLGIVENLGFVCLIKFT
ncbi:MAG: hypothetical protein Q4B95_09640 [Lonepinella koalarum]|nr:hypothetical protein [Lonepinella koalarum]